MDYKQEELILSVQNVSLSFGNKKVLKNISFDIHNITRPQVVQGQIVALLATSGTGKSCLFKIMSGFNKPNSGKVLIDIDQHEVKMGEMGVVPQDYPLLNHRKVFSNLAQALPHKTKAEIKDTIEDYANHFDLIGELQKYPCDLSGGQRQRVSILQQVLAGNRFILLDEPFSGLDFAMKDKVIELLIKVSNLNEYNTLVIVSHDIESTCAISDTIHVLANKNGEGATVIQTYDMMKEDLVWHPDIKELPKFRQILKQIKNEI